MGTVILAAGVELSGTVLDEYFKQEQRSQRRGGPAKMGSYFCAALTVRQQSGGLSQGRSGFGSSPQASNQSERP